MTHYKPQTVQEYRELSSMFQKVTPYDFTVTPSIDVLKITIPFQMLPSNFTYRFFKENGFKIHMRKYNSSVMILSTNINAVTSKIFCAINKKTYRTVLVLRQPHRSILDFLLQILHPLQYSVSEVEYALDIRGCDNGKLFGFLASHAILKYAGTFFHKAYNSTQYLNSIRHTKGYGCKVYIKNKNNEEFVRIEMTIKKRALNKLCVYSIHEILTQKAGTIFSRLQIKVLKYQIFVKNNNTVNIPHDVLLDKIFEIMNTDKYCSGIVCVKEFIKQATGSTSYYFDTHVFEKVFKGVIENITFEK